MPRKRCKGTGKAAGFEGCGRELEYTLRDGKRTYLAKSGLGLNCCYPKWHLSTDKGREMIAWAAQKGKKQAESERKNKIREEKIKLLSPDAYRAKYVQPRINEIARLLDSGFPCIATGRHQGTMHGGHFISVGKNRTTALNLHNVHKQCAESNVFKSGDERKYRLGLIERYGNDYFEFVDGLERTPPIKLSKDELMAIHKKAKEIIKRLKNIKDNIAMTGHEARIIMRNKYNEELGIYPQEFTTFNIQQQ